MKNKTNNERNYRLGYEIVRAILFPIVILVVMLCFSKYVEKYSNNSIGHAICILLSIMAGLFCLYRLIYNIFYTDKIYNNTSDYSIPHWFIIISEFITNGIQYLSDKITKKGETTAFESLDNSSPIETNKTFPSHKIEWEQYSSELRNELLRCWRLPAPSKELRLAAPVVVLIEAHLLFSKPNYSQIIKFFNDQLNESIDNSQFSNACDSIMGMIENPSRYSDLKYKNKLEHYRKVKEALNKHLDNY